MISLNSVYGNTNSYWDSLEVASKSHKMISSALEEETPSGTHTHTHTHLDAGDKRRQVNLINPTPVNFFTYGEMLYKNITKQVSAYNKYW